MFPCQTKHGCPKTRSAEGKRFCPLWYEGDENGVQMLERNVETRETRMVRGCVMQVLPRLLQYTVSFQECTRAEMHMARQEVGAAVRDSMEGVARLAADAMEVTQRAKLQHHTD